MLVKTVVIADDEPITRLDLGEILAGNSFLVLASVPTGLEAVEACRKNKPDLVILDVKMPLLDGIKAAKIINDENLAGCVVLLTAYSDKDIIKKSIEAGVTGYIVKPFDEETIIPAIRVSMARQKEIDEYKDNIKELNKKMEERVVIEKAKGLFSSKNKTTEDQAYSYMRSTAMSKGLKLIDVAKAILLSDED